MSREFKFLPGGRIVLSARVRIAPVCAVVMLFFAWCESVLPAETSTVSRYSSELRLAWQCHTNEDYANSVTHYQTAIQICPQSLEARLGYLLPLFALNRFTEAETLATRVVTQHPANYYANLRLAYALRMQNKHEQAEAVLNYILPLYPTDVSLLLELALVKLATRKNAAAKRLFNDVLTLAPGNPVAQQQLASKQLLNALFDDPRSASAGTSSIRSQAVAGKTRITASIYYAYLDYHHTASKDHAHSGGLYASLGYGLEHLFEIEADNIHKLYRDFPSLRQWDTTIAYANLSIPHVKLRLGGHYVTSEDPFTDQGWVAFVGADYYIANRGEAGVDGYYTKYPKFQDGLEVVQLTPHVGVNLWHGTNHTLYNDVRGYWIRLNRDFEGQRNFFSVEDRLSLNWRRWTFSAFGWAGQQMFAVRNEGFALYNLGEEHKAGYGVEIRYDFTAHLAFTLRANREEFRDLNITPHATSDMYLAMLSWKL